jgi:hypothetical protein
LDRDDDLDEICDRIREILLFETWDDDTKASLDCYLKLREVPYIVEDHLTSGNGLKLVLKVNGVIHHVTIG